MRRLSVTGQGAPPQAWGEDEKTKERLLTAVCMSLYFIQELIEMDKSKDRICEVVMIDGCKVIMKFTQAPKPEVMDRVKHTAPTLQKRKTLRLCA